MKAIHLRLLLVAVLLSATFQPLSSQLLIGYCDDNIPAKGQGAGSAANTMHAAMRLTDAQLSPSYQVAALYVGLSVTEGITSFRAWITTELGGGDTLACVPVEVDRLQRGWNVITLPDGVSIGDRPDLYFGYSYTQTQRIYPISYSGTRGQADSFWLGLDTRWSDYNARYGPVSIRAAVRSPYANDVHLLSAGLDKRVVARGDSILVTASLQNLGSDTLRSFVASWQCAGHSASTAFDCDVPFGQRAEFSLPIPIPDDHSGANHAVTFEVVQPNGGDDAQPDDNVWTLYYDCLDEVDNGQCGLLVEEFTSLRNGYAPLGHARLMQAFSQVSLDLLGDESAPELIYLSRHEGYGPDDGLRVSSSSDYAPTIFGSQGLSFAPAATFDRSRSQHHDTLMNADGAAASALLPAEQTMALIGEAAMRPRYCYLHLYGNLQPLYDGKMNIDVTVYSPCPSLLADARFEAVLVQDTLVVSDAGNYYPDEADGLTLLNVVRSYVTPEQGQDLCGDAPLDDIMTGNAPFGDATLPPGEGNALAVRQFTLRFDRPATIPAEAGWSLVVYVHGRDARRTVYAAKQVQLP